MGLFEGVGLFEVIKDEVGADTGGDAKDNSDNNGDEATGFGLGFGGFFILGWRFRGRFGGGGGI